MQQRTGYLGSATLLDLSESWFSPHFFHFTKLTEVIHNYKVLYK